MERKHMRHNSRLINMLTVLLVLLFYFTISHAGVYYSYNDQGRFEAASYDNEALVYFVYDSEGRRIAKLNILDTDNDGLRDSIETAHACLSFDNDDTDGDGILDGWEDYTLDGIWNVDIGETDPCDPDSDDDGLDDSAEMWQGTDPNSIDTDGDQVSDGDEVLLYGTDPLDPDSYPRNVPALGPASHILLIGLLFFSGIVYGRRRLY